MLITNATINLYPGMITRDVEFFFDGHTTRFFQNGQINDFEELCNYNLSLLQEAIDQDLDAKMELSKMFPNNEKEQLKKFAKCRFGGLDFTADICKKGKLQAGEYWECPFRGQCTGEGKICKQVRYGDHIITELEIKVIKLLCSDYTRHESAEVLQLPYGTFDYHAKKVFKKLEVVNQAQLTSRAIALNIVQPE